MSLHIIIICLLLWVAFFDFKDRSIPVLLLVALSILAIIHLYTASQFNILYFGINACLLGIQILLMVAWFWWRKKGQSFFKEAFGLGDVWILFISAVFFEPLTFVWFIVIASLVSLITGIILKFLKTEAYQFIPLAAIVSVIISIHLIFNLVS